MKGFQIVQCVILFQSISYKNHVVFLQVLLEHEEKVWVPLQEVGVELLGGLDGLAHSTWQHQLLDLCKPTVNKQKTLRQFSVRPDTEVSLSII